jgi:hypothetical protein
MEEEKGQGRTGGLDPLISYNKKTKMGGRGEGGLCWLVWGGGGRETSRRPRLCAPATASRAPGPVPRLTLALNSDQALRSSKSAHKGHADTYAQTVDNDSTPLYVLVL